MMSMSASWFFVVVSEALIVAHQSIRLPGVGSYIALAIEHHDLHALFYAIVTMLLVIFIYDQVFFRPLLVWSDNYRLDDANQDESYESWLVDWVRKSLLMRRFNHAMVLLRDVLINIPRLSARPRVRQFPVAIVDRQRRMDWLWNGLCLAVVGYLCWHLWRYIFSTLYFDEVLHVLLLGAITGLRVIVLIALSSLLWIPVGVWIGRRAHFAQKSQAIIQFCAAFPANLFYPLFVIAIVRFHLNVEIWLTPLMILGTQWYILFNVIAGASMIPRDLCLVADNFGVTGWQWWRRLALPAVFPYCITGAITAAGGAWNASIVAEWVSWGSTTLHATGLGEYIQVNTLDGHFDKLVLGTSVMCLYVLLFNQLIWHPLYRHAAARFNDS